jgi:hypothetical protein
MMDLTLALDFKIQLVSNAHNTMKLMIMSTCLVKPFETKIVLSEDSANNARLVQHSKTE